MTSSSYVDEVLAKFIRRHEGQYLDHSHAYGPQAPDLIEYYLTDLLGHPWQFRAGAAVDLWEDRQGAMADFERIERGPQKQVSVDFRPGDVLVFKGGQGFGTVGIYVRPGSRVGSVQMFTQNPGPAKVIDIMVDGYVNQLLGGWRLTHGAECKAMTSKFAAQLGYDPTCPAGDLSGYEAYTWPGATEQVRDYFTTNPAEPGGGHWMKAVSVERTDEELPPRRFFYSSGRGHGKTALLERWKKLFGK